MSKLTIENDNGKILVSVDGQAIGLIQKVKVNCKANKLNYKFDVSILDLSIPTNYDTSAMSKCLFEENKRAIELLSSVPGVSIKRVALSSTKSKNKKITKTKEYEFEGEMPDVK